MDDSELFTWYRYACIVWARANGDAGADSTSFKLVDPGTGVISISSWTSTAPQPDTAQLKAVGVPACAALKDLERVHSYMRADYTLVDATQAQLDTILAPPEGAIVLNTSIPAVQVYLGGAWVTVTPAEPDIVFPRIAAAGSAPSMLSTMASPRMRATA
jgi:hypothetical protein